MCRPCSPYQSARAGSITRTITFSTPKRFWAIWAMIRFVLSPSVEAMNTSARSMPGLDESVDLERRADGELAAGVLPALALSGVEALVRERVLVEHRDLVAGGQRRLGDCRADAAGADDQDEHEPQIEDQALMASASSTLEPPAQVGARALGGPSRRAAGAVTITRQSALLTTYL